MSAMGSIKAVVQELLDAGFGADRIEKLEETVEGLNARVKALEEQAGSVRTTANPERARKAGTTAAAGTATGVGKANPA